MQTTGLLCAKPQMQACTAAPAPPDAAQIEATTKQDQAAGRQESNRRRDSETERTTMQETKKNEEK